jgi:hypothetical protein
MNRTFAVTLLALTLPISAPAADSGLTVVDSSLVSLSVEVDGRAVPLYRAPDGRRLYLEARQGAGYALLVGNRSGQRLGVLIAVDGINVVSGQRDQGRGRMYVLGPSEQVRVSGWRTSLAEVRRFEFVDEARSYAARSEQANGKMGWIELRAFRERQWRTRWPTPLRQEGESAPSGSSPEAPRAKAAPAEDAAGSGYPGTGWGERSLDPAQLVSFDPEAEPTDTLTLRYEYAPALRALGILREPCFGRDRLRERERGQDGFAPEPIW